jgi:signal transduction histidine kinase
MRAGESEGADVDERPVAHGTTPFRGVTGADRAAWHRSLVESMDQGFCVCEMLVDDAGRGVDYRFLEINPRFPGMTGIRADAVGHTARELVPGLEQTWIDVYARVGLDGETLRFQQGSEAMGRWFDVLAWPMGDRRFGILFVDETERRRAEAALRDSEERARLAIELVGLGTWRYDPGADRVLPDARMREIWGLPPAGGDPTLKDALARIHPDDRARVEAAVAVALDPEGPGTYAVETRLVWPDGQTRWVMAQGGTRFEAGEDGVRRPVVFFGTALDVTDQRRANDALRSSETRLSMTTEAAQVGTWQWDIQGGDVLWSDIHKGQWGLPPGSEPVRYEDWAAAIHPDDLPTAEAAIASALAGIGPYDVAYRIRPAGSSDERWIRSVGRATMDPDGRPRSMQGISIDITESKRVEAALRESEARLQRALVAKDEFLGFVSHELRTPMTVILGMSRILEKGDLDPTRARELARDVVESAEVLDGVVESMLLLARIDRDEAGALREPVLLHHVASDVVDAYRTRDASRPYELVVRSRAALADVQPAWLVRVVDNLVGNAAKYSTAREAITVVVDADEAAHRATLDVLDHGPGLSDEELTRVFEAFYRAPSAVERAPGAGLGLAVAQRIVELLGGTIEVERRAEGGMRFCVSLPLVETPTDG